LTFAGFCGHFVRWQLPEAGPCDANRLLGDSIRGKEDAVRVLAQWCNATTYCNCWFYGPVPCPWGGVNDLHSILHSNSDATPRKPFELSYTSNLYEYAIAFPKKLTFREYFHRVHLYNTLGTARYSAHISCIIVNVGIIRACATGIEGKVGILGLACFFGMSYGNGRIGTTLIPDKSKPTATWGRKAMGQRRIIPAAAMVVARLPKEFHQ
jgi:hypothetical protein